MGESRCASFFGELSPAPGWLQFGITGRIEEALFTSRAAEEKDGYVYVLDRNGVLRTFDLTGHLNSGVPPTYSDPIDTQEGNKGNALFVLGDFLYVFDAFSGVDTYSLANPTAPLLQSSVSGARARSVVEQSGYLLAVANALRVLSLDDPSTPEVIQTLPLHNPWAIGAADGYLYISTFDTSAQTSGIEVIDFTQPPTATSVGFVEVGPQLALPYRLQVVGPLLVACASGGVGFWSLSNPVNPALTDTRSIGGGRACVVYDHHLVTNGEVFDVRPPFVRTGTFPPGGSQGDGAPYGSIVRPGRVYLAQSGGIQILQPPPAATLAQYVDGEAGAFQNRSRLILENGGEEEMTGSVIFRLPDGNPAPAGGVAFPPEPVGFTLPPQGSFEFSTGGTGDLSAGPAEVRLDSMQSRGLQVTLIYQLLGNFVSVNQASLGREHSAYVTRNDEETTAIAIYNPSPADPALFQVSLLDAQGAMQGEVVHGTLPPGHQRAIFVTDPDLFGDRIPADFRGRIELIVTNDKPVYSMAIIQRTDGALLSVATVVKP